MGYSAFISLSLLGGIQAEPALETTFAGCPDTITVGQCKELQEISRQQAHLEQRKLVLLGEIAPVAETVPQQEPPTESAEQAPPGTENPQDHREDPPASGNGHVALTNQQFAGLVSAINASGDTAFEGLGFGAGIAATFDMGSNDRISDADVFNGIVRVKDQDNTTARFMLESHYFFTPPEKNFLGLDQEQWGWGPFVAIEAGSDPLIQAIGGGVMIGLRRRAENPLYDPNNSASERLVYTNKSFNFGVGWVWDLNNRILGEGFVANQPPPDGETTVRFLEKTQSGLLIMTSYAFN